MQLRIIDITKDVFECPVYPGDPEPGLELVSGFCKGDICNTAKISMCLHTGTHADAPLHFIDNGAPINSTELSVYIGECVVVECSAGLITGEVVNRYFPKADRILVKGNGEAFFDVTAAEELTFAGVKLIGTDAASIGAFGNEAAPHKAFLRDGTVILENLDLSEVQPGKYFLMAQPLKIKGVEAAPCRAVLIEDYLFWGGKRGLGTF